MMKSFRFLLLAAPFLLAACGDEWEMIRTDKYVPYGNTRTAGTGVAYVLAKMLPKKELNLVPAKTEAPVVTPPPAPEKVFHEAQKK